MVGLDTVGAFSFLNLMGFKLRLIDICKKELFTCSKFVENFFDYIFKIAKSANMTETIFLHLNFSTGHISTCC